MEFIADLPADSEGLSSGELRSLEPIWREQKRQLNGSKALEDFQEKLRREWAIETGIIERLYTIDRGTTNLLIEKGLVEALIPHGASDLAPGAVIGFLRDHKHVVDGLFDFVASRRQLSISYIHELHVALTLQQETVEGFDSLGRNASVPLVRGAWKQWPNNPTRADGRVHEYTPPVHVAAEMDRLVGMLLEHEDRSIAPEIASAWLHHRFTQIHPYQDGNGRVARALATLIFLRSGWFPLVIRRDDREKYLDALELADTGNLAPLVSLFTEQQKKALRAAIDLSEDALNKQSRLSDMAAAVAAKLRGDGETKPAEAVLDVPESGALVDGIESLFEIAKRDILAGMGDKAELADFSVGSASISPQSVGLLPISHFSKELGYAADTSRSGIWIEMSLAARGARSKGDIVAVVHAIRPYSVGLKGVIAFYRPRREENGEITPISSSVLLCDAPLQFVHNEGVSAVLERLRPWLDSAILLGLNEWRKSL